MSPEYEREYHATIERISQRLDVAIGHYLGNGIKRDYTKAAQWAEKGME